MQGLTTPRANQLNVPLQTHPGESAPAKTWGKANHGLVPPVWQKRPQGHSRAAVEWLVKYCKWVSLSREADFRSLFGLLSGLAITPSLSMTVALRQ